MPAAIPAVAAIAGGLIAAKGAKSAAQTQAASADRAADLNWKQYEQTREDQAPWRAAGTTALSQLVGGLAPGGEYNRGFTMADYLEDPGYQFRLSEGEKGIDRAAAARGSKYSGATLKALARFNSDQASQEFGNSYNRFETDIGNRFGRLASVAGIGQAATNQVGAAGASAAATTGQAIQDAGTARASGYVGTGNAINGALGQVSNYYSLSSLLPKTSSFYADTTPSSIRNYSPPTRMEIPSLPSLERI
ncbi:DNA transfer protein p32 [Massilia sp. NEAU-DD11]|uniref:DNA transfer protein p32 n=1 Tax=Massilia cellulosiltytica TaxID=2683234 RepID=A0A7X3G6E2_9BURK|nr:DNA transfer protein p32 [Telluria cellulosilytica]MVW64522.1 DNA transfer protein p32 [Telluria cellulosilytica]